MDYRKVFEEVYRCIAMHRLGLDSGCLENIARYENAVGAKPIDVFSEEDLSKLGIAEKFLNIALNFVERSIVIDGVAVIARYGGNDLCRGITVDSSICRRLAIECHKRLHRLGVEHPERGVARAVGVSKAAKMLKHLFSYGYIVEKIESTVPPEIASRTEVAGLTLAYLGIFTYLDQSMLYLETKDVDSYIDKAKKILEKLCRLAIYLKTLEYEELPMLAIPSVARYILRTRIKKIAVKRRTTASPSS